MCVDQRYLIEKQQMASAFSAAAAQYDQWAGLQQRCAQRLLDLCPEQVDGTCLDVGCGTGQPTQVLAERYGHCVGLDLAAGMLRQAQQTSAADLAWVQADAEALPLQTASCGLVFSNFAWQWSQDIHRLLAEVSRVLRPGGSACFTTLGPKTLTELRQSWQQVDQQVHVNQFYDLQQWQAALATLPLQVQQHRVELHYSHYPDVVTVMRALKAVGAHNTLAGRAKGLMGRQRLQRLQQAYETWRSDQGLPVCYQVYFFVVERQ